jgi:coenzyme F420 hydrogenase subunit beta
MASNTSARKSLAILQNESPLRGRTPLSTALNWQEDKKDSSPRALRALSQIINSGLCHRCGSCVGICPTGVLHVDGEEYPRIQNVSACTDCDLCVKVCPGDEFSYAAQYEKKFGKKAELTSTHGFFKEAVIAHSGEAFLREDSTSGGMVTALLLHLLETKQIDGALVIASDEKTLWKGKPIIARTRAELLATAKSKYAITATNTLLSEIRTLEGQYAIVGLPCQIHGVVKAAELDERLNSRIALTIGLFCHAAIEHEAFKILWDHLGDKTKNAKRFISRVGKHPGTPHLELEDGSLYPVYFGERSGYRPSSIEVINILYRLYTPDRCLTCFDATAEFADISVGDPWMAPPESDVDFHKGWSFALVRTPRGKAALDASQASNYVQYRTVTRKEALACNSLMAGEKRWRAFRVLETHHRQGKSVPSYGAVHQEYPRHSGFQFVETELHMLSHIFCFLPRLRAAVLKFFLGKGYWLFWLNSKRRALRFFIRDSKARLRRQLFGRK